MGIVKEALREKEEIILDYDNGFFDNVDLVETTSKNRVYNCQAWYSKCGYLILLRSYSTIVGAYSCRNNVMYIFGRYSSTTYQHIRKFERLFEIDRENEINLQLVDNWGTYSGYYYW